MQPQNLFEYSLHIILHFWEKIKEHPALYDQKIVTSDPDCDVKATLATMQHMEYVPQNRPEPLSIYIHAHHLVEGQELTAGIAIHYDPVNEMAQLVLMPLDLGEGSPLVAFTLSQHDDLARMSRYYCNRFIEQLEEIHNDEE